MRALVKNTSAAAALEAPSAGVELEKIKPSDIYVPNRLAKIDNDAPVEFNPGMERKITIAGRKFACSEYKSSGKVPGADCAMPVVRYFCQQEFMRLQEHLDGSINGNTLAWWDKNGGPPGSEDAGAIEVRLSECLSRIGPIRMKASEAKALLAVQYHEALHAAGANEFDACLQEDQYRIRLGLSQQFANGLSIMAHILRNGYEDSEISRSEESFVGWARADQSRAPLMAQYYELLERQVDSELGDLLLEGLD